MKTAVILTVMTMMSVALSPLASQATLLAWDSFAISEGGNDYYAGPIQGQNPSVGCGGFCGAWGASSGSTDAFVPSPGGLTHDLVPGTSLQGLLMPYTEDVGFANRRLSRAICYTPTNGTYYASILLRKTHATDGDLVAGLAPAESTNWDFSTLQGTYVGLSQGGIVFLTTGYIDPVVATNQVHIGETYFTLMQFDYSLSAPDKVTVTVYDGSSTEIANRAYTSLDLDGDIGRFGILTSDLPPTVAVDEWRFGTERSDVMVVPANGDFNGDGDIDGADFLVWQRDPGLGDLVDWETHYGSPLAATAAPIPEPSTMLLLTVGLFVTALRNQEL